MKRISLSRIALTAGIVCLSLSQAQADTFVAPSFPDFIDEDGNFNLSTGDEVDWTSTNLGSRNHLTFGQDAFTSIQEAIDAVAFGGRVHIAAGNYAEGSKITVAKSVTILGDGAKFTEVNGGAAHRVFEISGQGFDVTLDGLSIVNGMGGGIVHSDGNLCVNACSISGNTSTFGGGLSTSVGTATVKNSTIYNNTVVGRNSVIGNFYTYGLGGGIYSFSTLHVINSTISGNAAEYGGGIYHATGTASVIHSTIVENTAERFPSSRADLTVGLGGGISTRPTEGTVSLANSIVAGNTADDSQPDVRGNFTSNGGNFIGTDTSTNNVFANDETYPPTSTNPLRQGLLAYWPFDATLADEINGNHGTMMGSNPSPTYAVGQFDTGIDLDGFDQHVEIPNEELFGFTQGTGFSASAWFRVDTFTKNWQALAAKGEGDSWRIHRRGSLTVMSASNGGNETPSGATHVLDGALHHIALVVDPANGSRLYVDGELEASNISATSVGNSNHPLLIGENPGSRGRSWDGLIDDFAIWTRPLTIDEVAGLWNNGAGTRVGDFITHTTIDDLLDTNLADNGGPTLTHALKLNSAAIGVGHNADATDAQGSPLTNEQRGAGYPRRRGESVDAGAVEHCITEAWVAPADTFTIAVDHGAPGLDAGDFVTWTSQTQGTQNSLFFGVNAFSSLSSAVAASCPGATIHVAAGTYSESVTISDSDFTIQGDGADITTIDGRNADRPFTITRSDVNIRGLTIRNGRADNGGAIQNADGNLQISQCSLKDNQATSDGGAIANVRGSLRIIHSTLANNQADSGGGVHGADGSLTIVNSTLSGNQAGNGGGGVRNQGGAIFLIQSTVAGNTTSASSGGGVWQEDNQPFILHNTIIAGNTAPSGPDIQSNASLMSNGANFIGNVSGISGSGALTDRTFSSTSTILPDVIDPVLANHGGPTETHALPLQSPAIDAGIDADALDPVDTIIGNGDDVLLTSDQRGVGFPRTNRASVDIGAVEFCLQSAWVSLNFTITTDVAPAGLSSNDTVRCDSLRSGTVTDLIFGVNAFSTIQDAVDAIECTPNLVTITQGAYAGGAPITLDKSIHLQGDSAESTSISGQDTHRIFDIPAGAHDIVLDSLTIHSGKADAALSNDPERMGGGIRNYSTGQLTLTQCTLRENEASQDGGGLYCHNSGPVIISQCVIANNDATWGGGLYLRTGSAGIISDSVITGNDVIDSGGGIFCYENGSVDLENCTVTENTASKYGAGIGLNESSAADLTDCLVNKNTAHLEGGGISSRKGSTLNLTHCDILENDAIDHGDGIDNWTNSTATIRHCRIEGNRARTANKSSGGGIHNGNGSQATIEDSVIHGNTAEQDGGGLINFSNGTLTAEACSFTGNSSKFGGGVYSRSHCTTTLTNCTLAHNQAQIYGGGIFNGTGCQTSITCSTLSGNTLTGPAEAPTWPQVQGAGIANVSGYIEVRHATLAYNAIDLQEAPNPTTVGGVGIANFGSSSSELWHCVLANALNAQGPDEWSGPAPINGGVLNFISSGQVTGIDYTYANTNTSSIAEIVRPLEDNGGLTLSHAPAPGSPIIDTGQGSLAALADILIDQREFPRIIGLGPDLGSLEAGLAGSYERWAASLPPGTDSRFGGDADNDGDLNGFEFGVDSDGNVPDSDSPRKPQVTVDENGHTDISFGFLPTHSALIWIVERSPDLVHFEEIYRRHDGVVTQATDVAGVLDPSDPTKIIVTDYVPLHPRSFYQVRVELMEPWR